MGTRAVRLAPAIRCALIVALGALVAACGSPNENHGRPYQTAVVSPVELPPYAGVRPASYPPNFDAFPGAKAYFGDAHGGVYRIEMPYDWNGSVLFYIHGGSLGALAASPPSLRSYLTQHHYAWAAASFDRVDFTGTDAADQTAALWDDFTAQFGRPKRAYLMGVSQGGTGTLLASERYGDRFDGALVECGISGDEDVVDTDGDAVIAAAFAVGLPKEKFALPAGPLLENVIIPPLNADGAKRVLFESLWVQLTGGERPFAHEGLRDFIAALWARSTGDFDKGLFDNAERQYTLPGNTPVDSAGLNANVARIKRGQSPAAVTNALNQPTGDIKIPVLTLNETGDANVPLRAAQTIRRRVENAGRKTLLVQRTVQSPEHCGSTPAELEASFQDLVSWVERGVRPAGEDVLSSDLTHIGEQFTLLPRVGSDTAEHMPHASERVTLMGTATVDGVPLARRNLDLAVERDGLITACTYGTVFRGQGDFRAVAAPDSEVPGCGGAGATLILLTQLENTGDLVKSNEKLDWSTLAHDAKLDVSFTSANDTVAFLSGDLLDVGGQRLGPGTSVSAYAGARLCAHSTIAPVGDAGGYMLLFDNRTEGRSCTSPGALSFTINDSPAIGVHGLGRFLDIQLR